jgi:putative hemolysin
MEFIILFALILLNGVFALSEIAVVSARKSRLQEMSMKGNNSAEIALELAEDSTRFLSTVQIGISLIGIFAGAFGGSALADDIGMFISDRVPALAPYANQIGFALIVLLTTYLSLVIGELVPKRLALSNPERFAVLIAPPMNVLSRITAPIVWFLSLSTRGVTTVLGARTDSEQSVTEGEILSMIREGIKIGRFATEEQYMVREIFDLDDTHVSELMTPRIDIIWFDVEEDESSIRQKLTKTRHSAYPVAQGSIDNVIGIVTSRDILANVVEDNTIDLEAIMQPPIFAPKTIDVASVLAKLNDAHLRMAVVLGEHGGIEGVLTINDIVAEVFGLADVATPEAKQQSDGSFIVDGNLAIDDLQRLLADLEIPADEQRDYHVLAGFTMTRLGRIPQVGDHFEWSDFRFEVNKMQDKRIEKVVIKPLLPDDEE